MFSYPAKDNDMNLNFITKMQKRYKLPVGFSDHSIGIEAPVVAAALGAKVIEKHFTLDNNFSNFRDHKVSLNPVNFKRMVLSVRRVENLIGKDLKFSIKDELSNESSLRRNFTLQEKFQKEVFT